MKKRSVTRGLWVLVAVAALGACTAAGTASSGSLVVPDGPGNPDAFRTNSIDSRAAVVPVYIEDHLEADPAGGLRQLVYYLTYRSENRYHAVKAIHDWIAAHIVYDYDTYLGTADRAQDWAAVLTNRTAVCGGYTNLFLEMARIAGIPAEYVSGFGKNSVHERYDHNHAWNAVRIEGDWHLVDVTWNGQGSVEAYNTDWLFPDPAAFVRSHLPADSAWQLVEQPITREQLYASSWISPSMASHGTVLIPETAVVSGVDLSLTLDRRDPPGGLATQVTVQVADSGGADRTSACTIEVSDATVTITFPGSDNWLVAIREYDETVEWYGRSSFVVAN